MAESRAEMCACGENAEPLSLVESVGTELHEIDLKTVSIPALAYLGDAVMELLVRSALVEDGVSTAKSLNRAAMDFVRAPVQAAAMERILPFLTEEEAAAFRRGRNIGHTNTPKSATVAEYRNATGMEVLFGHLYLSHKMHRAKELFDLAYVRKK